MTSTEYDMGYKDGYKNCLKANGLDKNTEPVSTETSSGKWCEHSEVRTGVIMSGGFIFKDDPERHKYCVTCAAPRPKELSLEEKLANMLRTEYDDGEGYARDWNHIAKAAINFLNQEKS